MSIHFRIASLVPPPLLPGFKIVRQRLYNCRLVKGQRYASSGPYGEDAVDFLRGPAWRFAAEVTWEVLKLVTWERSRLMEWFDLHAKL